MGSVLYSLQFLHLLQTWIPESESGCVISSPRTRRGQPRAQTHPSRRHVPMSHSMCPRVHSHSQCLHLRTAGLSTRTTVRHPNTTYPHHSLGTLISGHWPPRGQWNPLAAKRSLLVAQYGPRREKDSYKDAQTVPSLRVLATFHLANSSRCPFQPDHGHI